MSKLLHASDADDDNNDAKAVAIPRVFSENCRAKKKKKKIQGPENQVCKK